MWVYVDSSKEVLDIENEIDMFYREGDFSEQMIDSLLDECYPTYEIAEVEFYPSEVVKKLAPSLYNQILEEEIERLIEEDLYNLEHIAPNDGDVLGDIILANIDYIIWKEDKDDSL